MIKPIKNKKKIETIFEKGKTISEAPLLVKVYDFKDDEVCFGVSVSKKHFKLAVSRNKIKRQLRSVIKKNVKSNAVDKGVSFFVIYNQKKSSTYSVLEASFLRVLEKL